MYRHLIVLVLLPVLAHGGDDLTFTAEAAGVDRIVERLMAAEGGVSWFNLTAVCDRQGVVPCLSSIRWTGLTGNDLLGRIKAVGLAWRSPFSVATCSARFRLGPDEAQRWWSALEKLEDATRSGDALLVDGLSWCQEGEVIRLGPDMAPPAPPVDAVPGLAIAIEGGLLGQRLNLTVDPVADTVSTRYLVAADALPVIDREVLARVPADVMALAVLAVDAADVRDRLHGWLAALAMEVPAWAAAFPQRISGTIALVVTGEVNRPVATLMLPVGEEVDAWFTGLLGIEKIPADCYLPFAQGAEFWMVYRSERYWFVSQDPLVVDVILDTDVAKDFQPRPVIDLPPADAHCVGLIQTRTEPLLWLVARRLQAGTTQDPRFADFFERRLRSYLLPGRQLPPVRLILLQEAEGVVVSGQGLLLPVLATWAMIRERDHSRRLQAHQQFLADLRTALEAIGGEDPPPSPDARPLFPGEKARGDSPIIYIQPLGNRQQPWMPLLVAPLPDATEGVALVFPGGAVIGDNATFVLQEAQRIVTRQSVGRPVDDAWLTVRNRLQRLRRSARDLPTADGGSGDGAIDIFADPPQ